MSSLTLSGKRWRRPALASGLAAAAALLVTAVGANHSAYAATVFSADFESGSSGWSKSGGTWTVVADGSQSLRQTNAGSENARQFAGATSWTDYTVTARVKPLAFGSGGFAGLLARSKSSTTFYRLALSSGQAQLQAVNSGNVTVLGTASRPVATGTWYTLSLSVSGSTITGAVDGATVGSGSSSVAASGRIGLQTAYASAGFDDVAVNTGGGGSTPTPTNPTSPPTSPPASPTTPPTSPGGNAPAWPTPAGSISLPNGTIAVSGTYDGGMKRICCIGDGGQSESQDPVFDLAPGATLKNVIIGAPAGDGVHCAGNCRLENVWWEDVGEDAATFLGGTDYYVVGGGARSGTDKVFQHNGPGTVHISRFYVQNSGKLYRACGNCSSSHQRHVVIDSIWATSTKVLAGINTNWGDTARFSNITILNDSSRKTVICDKYKGVPKGSEPSHIGSGADGVNCLYQESDITWR
ncbi:pectate lyase [Actinoplanes sp. M2I2]|uniref:pectate lyase n=1 Tax=Actinoplanes sp. M2I2 TaxID=1734444 RepID=UPI0020207524|nr:pectate lyase [Actinoplanes sp. M2I2]